MLPSGQKFCLLSSIYKIIQPLVRHSPIALNFRGFSHNNHNSICKPAHDHSWANDPECGPDECQQIKRMDEACPPEKKCNKGPYAQTWAECPARPIEKVPLCLAEKLPVRTPRKGIVREVSKQMGLIDRNERCLKVRMPGCKDIRKVVKCRRTRMPFDCVPIPAPCLSFSECEKDLPPWKQPTECNCYEIACEPTD